MESIAQGQIRAWVRKKLFHPKRTRAIVAITTRRSVGGFFVDPARLEEQLGEHAEVVAIETGGATFELAEALPHRLDVYGGAMRVWWPGLTPASDPYAHKLYLIHSEDEGRAQVARLRGELLRRAGLDRPRSHTGPGSPQPSSPVETERVTVSVLSLKEGVLLQEPDGCLGRLVDADVPVDALEVCLREGMELSVTRPREHDWTHGEAPCSAKATLPSPWERIGAELKAGDIVQGRVVHIDDPRKYALIELLPDVCGIVFQQELDHTFVEEIQDILTIGELVHVQILELDANAERAHLSVKAAQIAQTPPRPLPSLVPGGEPFDWSGFLRRTGVEVATVLDPREVRIQELESEIEAAGEDRANLRKTITSLREKLRSLEGRYRDLERRSSGLLDPLSGERDFLRAVRVWYASEIGEGERCNLPLKRMRVGHRFLESARSLAGVSAEKIVQVAGQVACDRAKDLGGREVHRLGLGGPATVTTQRTRERDGAKAWRCSLQANTPSARRLHWWVIPGPEGATIEFASVAVHDVFEIPE